MFQMKLLAVGNRTSVEDYFQRRMNPHLVLQWVCVAAGRCVCVCGAVTERWSVVVYWPVWCPACRPGSGPQRWAPSESTAAWSRRLGVCSATERRRCRSKTPGRRPSLGRHEDVSVNGLLSLQEPHHSARLLHQKWKFMSSKINIVVD